MSDFKLDIPEIISIGVLPQENLNSWFCGKYALREGYICCRKLLTNCRKVYKIYCKIKKSSTGNPIFECVAELENVNSGLQERQHQQNENIIVRSLSATGVAKNLFAKLGLRSKMKWPGSQFYGVSLQSYRNKIESSFVDIDNDDNHNNTAATLPQTIANADKKEELVQSQPDASSEIVSIEKENNFADTECHTITGTNFQWLKVISFGNYLQHFPCVGADKQKVPITSGFKSARLKECEVMEEFSIPIYKITCPSTNICIKDPVSSVAVQNFLAEMKSVGTKHWSGSEFFGFTRKEVSTHLRTMCPSIEVVDYEVLKAVAAFRKRSAGETSGLSKKGQTGRNKLIHRAVDFISFGDIKSKLNNFITVINVCKFNLSMLKTN